MADNISVNIAPVLDFHMHSTVSDGTDTPAGILDRVRDLGLECFALTDHDDVKGSRMIRGLLREGDPVFITGCEFSCRDDEGKYHILGYGFDPDSDSIMKIMDTCHRLRFEKIRGRMEKLQQEFGFHFPQEEIDALYALDNPGKPHIGNLMVKLGYATSINDAIERFIGKVHYRSRYIRPEEAIESILAGGGIPVLAHPSYGSGDELILGDDMEHRLQKLVSFGLQGIEAYYSGFTARLRQANLDLAARYSLYVTAGSDYHGTNKMVVLGDTGLPERSEWSEGLLRFLNDVRH